MPYLFCVVMVCLLGMAIPTASGPVSPNREVREKACSRTLTFAERVAYQRAIEEVYWRHRIWPKENLGSKPPLDAVISQAQLEEKVEDYLRKSQLVINQRGSPITDYELQAEIERMAAHTKQPEVLRELFEPLRNDPFVIAECLARPALAERFSANPTVVAGVPPALGKLFATETPASIADRIRVTANLDNVEHKPPEVSISNDCADDTWTATTTVSAPDGRFDHTAIWTGNEMIVWGGFNNSPPYFLNTGGRYNPATDSWIATSAANAPVGRDFHTAVWTGAEMIVWGGYNNGDDLNTGGRYNPTTDTWTATSVVNAPEGREQFRAVWTGNEMIVWGGLGCGSNCRLNTGGRYNPAMDSWTATSTINAPSARFAHTAVWTGSRMTVWGGSDSTNYLHTGGRYDPSIDSWTVTSTVNAPLGRIAHTTVWTDNEMIVWGGVDETFNDTNTGGRYNPTEDTWIAINTVNAPSARDSHTAVWNGSQMIVWGGVFCCPAIDFDTGGRYDATTDSWTGTSTANAPLARWAHTAVWTGGGMLVWGGYNDPSNVFLDTGGGYCAPPTATPTPTPTATTTPTATPSATATATPRIPPTPRARPTPRPRP